METTQNVKNYQKSTVFYISLNKTTYLEKTDLRSQGFYTNFTAKLR